MEWIINLIKKIFKKNKIKLIEAPKEEIKKEKADFLLEIKRTADLERNDQNGYKIIKKYSLKDMV